MSAGHSLSIEQAERRFKALRRTLPHMKVKGGWIAYVRHTIGMTFANLAKAADLSIPTVQQMEKREAKGQVTLQTLEKIAQAMNCELIYAFVPKQPINEYLKEKAQEKATRLIKQADVHMQLEDQRVEDPLKARVARLAQELFDRRDVW
ncbi:helix-turn-helix domain-containing protein [Oligoflexus tunisiensis]|uniref:helix-turn-helix domain-containing protein n=1 Tax=Oligoflexus tunisiensis TaxID=708132 RepID=UPI001C4039F2|nr:helix-turn-helix domain-containing protein [Oligoflexus tunisiensis]